MVSKRGPRRISCQVDFNGYVWLVILEDFDVDMNVMKEGRGKEY